MTLRFSTGLTNFLNEGGSMKHALANGVLKIYSGSQPATADAALTGTLLAIVTDASGALTAETQSTGTLTLDSGGSGSVDTFTVNSLEIMGSSTAFDTSLTVTAANIVTKVNDNPFNLLFKASSSGAVITLTAKPGLGALANAWVVAATYTTIAGTPANMGSGVSAVNGLKFGDSAAGILSKLSSQTWSGLGLDAGTAGYFRLFGSVVDGGSADAAELYLRVDGAIATSGSQLNSTNTTVAVGATQTVGTFTLTLPNQQA